MLGNLEWLISLIKEKGINTPKTIIFCDTLYAIANVANYLMMKLGSHAFHPTSSVNREDCLIGIMHSAIQKKYKDRLLQSLKGDGTKRVAIATTSLSMGVNFPDIRHVIMFGLPRSMLDLHQEAGRGGRDGLPTEVSIIFYGQQASHCDDDVRAFINSSGCWRVAAYSLFDENIPPSSPAHSCCNFCLKTCICSPEGCPEPTKPLHSTDHETQILLMFYFNVFYFPYLKSRLKKAKSLREVCQWYVQMLYYHAVYVPLLLRLSNDVEENPGPRTINDIVDPTHTVHADFNQGNELMFGMNAGKQCVAMSLCAIVYKEIKSVSIWDRLMLNSILIRGNNLYGIISQSIFKSYLLLTDVPEFVDINNRAFNLQYSNSFSAALHMSEGSLPYVTLEHALNEVFVSLHNNSCLLTVGMNTVAIMMPFPGVFKVFDSHSRDVFGRPSALGYCVLISVEGIENLGEYFRLTSRSNVVIPFELKGVKCIGNVDMETELSTRVITNSVKH